MKNSPDFDFGKVPPQDIRAEEVLLGNLLMNSEDISLIDIEPKMFYADKHKKIATAMFEMLRKNKEINFISLSDYLKSKKQLDEVGGEAFLMELMNNAAGNVNNETLAEIIKRHYISRELINLFVKSIKRAYDDEGDEIINDVLRKLSEITGTEEKHIYRLAEALEMLYNDINRNAEGKTNITGIRSGLTKLDEHTMGFQKGDLIIIAGEPSQGKTALALRAVFEAIANGKRAAFYSYEMTIKQLAARLLSMQSGVNSKLLQYSKLKDDEYVKVNDGIGTLFNRQLFIDDVPSTKFSYLEKSLRMLVAKEKIDIAIIDYVQLIRDDDPRKNKADATADIANSLKGLAKTLDIPIILISQLARDRANPKPTIARLKNSGDLEAAADVIILTWRPEFYNISSIEILGRDYPAKETAHIMAAKGRNIGTTEFPLHFNPLTTFFSDYIETEEYEFNNYRY